MSDSYVLNAYKCLILMQAKRAYHKTRSLSSPPPAEILPDPHKTHKILTFL